MKDESGQTKGAMVQDMMTKEKWEVAAKAVINATGCFCDAIRCAKTPNLVIMKGRVRTIMSAFVRRSSAHKTAFRCVIEAHRVIWGTVGGRQARLWCREEVGI